MPKLRLDSKAGGDIAGNARKRLEHRLGKSIVSKNNYLSEPEKNSRKKLK
jgi:hypothetical protein